MSQHPGSRIRVLVVDDERGLCDGVQEALQRKGYRVDAAHNGESALVLAEKHLYNVVVSDLKMPGIGGLDLLDAIKTRCRDTVCILMTAHGTIESAVDALRRGAYDYLTKPLDMRRLRAVVEKALEHQSLVAENHELRLRLKKPSEPSPLIGSSEGMQQIGRLVDEVAASDATVLIEGESGTGKEIVARMIHFNSLRHERPYISVNCAALPEHLLEAELFGHVKGAFTGAVQTRPGRFQLAHGGTLFLDEIGDLPAKGQGDLLRVLEDGTFRMVGGTKPVQVDVRMVAATNRDLLAEVEAGNFREDLYYRLQIVPIHMPPLRDRADDIPLLIAEFLEHFRARHKRGPSRFTAEALELCQRFPWPGNIRQLRNLIERTVLTCHVSAVDVAALPDFLRDHDQTATSFPVRPGMALSEVEKLLIRQTLLHVTQNRARAASVLGISRRALQYKLKRYGLLGADSDASEPPHSPT